MLSVIFDMDGTLLDTQRIAIPAWDYAGKNQGIENMGRHVPFVCGMNEKGRDDYLAKNAPEINMEQFIREYRAYITENLVVKYKTGAVQLLEFLKQKGIKIGLASGTSEKSVMHHLKEVDALKYFDAIVTGTSVEKGKPEPDIFLLTAEKMGVSPENCFVFEDSPNGILSAFRAGMKCIGVPDIVSFSDDTKKLLFKELKTLDEAIEILKKFL